MKNKILFLIFCLPFILKSQQSSGEIKYEERIKIIIDLPEGNESFKKTLPPSQNILKTLLFTSNESYYSCLLYTSDAADERSSVDLGGRRIIKKKKKIK